MGHETVTRGSTVHVALGANLASAAGGPAATLRAALAALSLSFPGPLRASRLYRTPAHPPGAGPDFANAVVRLQSDLAPAAILTRLHAIERDFARIRTRRWAPRTLDLDLLDVGSRILPDAATERAWRNGAEARGGRLAPESLILPHPRLGERGFVLIPLADIAPDWVHPGLGTGVRAMISALAEADRTAPQPL